MDVVDVVKAFGGATRWKPLRAQVPRVALRHAVRDGRLRHEHGVYFLPPQERPLLLAQQLQGVLSHRSAAEHWGFALPPLPRGEPARYDVAIPAKSQRRNVPADGRLRYVRLDASDVEGAVLARAATVALCLRDLSLREALSVGDSALASGRVTRAEIASRVARFRGPGHRRAMTRLDLLDRGAANAFESSCRATLLEAGITGFRPQVTIRHRGQWVGRADLADAALRVLIECDGFETHGTLDAMVADCARHAGFVAAGWRPLRFTWVQVMFHPDWVLAHVSDTIACATHTAPVPAVRP